MPMIILYNIGTRKTFCYNMHKNYSNRNSTIFSDHNSIQPLTPVCNTILTHDSSSVEGHAYIDIGISNTIKAPITYSFQNR